MRKRVPLKRYFFERISRLVPTGKILGIGCSTGDLLDLFKSAGYETFGVEISKFAADYCSRKGHQVYWGTIDKAPFPKNYFDAINMSLVFLHLKLITFLKLKIFQAKPGLYKYCLNFLDKDSWKKLVALSKFKFLDLGKLGHSSKVYRDYMNKTVLGQNRFLKGAIRILDFFKIDQRFDLERLHLFTFKK